MYAIIKTGGKQYKVEEDQVITIEKLEGEEGDTVEFDEIKAVSSEDTFEVGQPNVEGAKVTGEILEHGKDDKIIVFKYKPKNNYRKKAGHRQPHTRVVINNIEV